MSRWFRWYTGSVEDGKFRAAARDACVTPLARDVTVRDVIAVWALILEDAADDTHRGKCQRTLNFMAAVLDIEEDALTAILNALQRMEMIEDGLGTITICNWAERQFETDKTDGTAATRQRRYREKKRNGSVTDELRPREQNTDTEADTERKKLSLRSSNAVEAKTAIEREFSETFYPAYPHKVQRAAALKAWPRARAKAALEQIMAGLERYVLEKPPDRHWQNPATFLNGESWNDQPASPPAANGKPSPHETILRSIARVVEKRGGLDSGEAGADERFHDHPGPAPPPRDVADDLEIPLSLRRY